MRVPLAGTWTLAVVLAAAGAFAGQGGIAVGGEPVEVAPLAQGETYGTSAETALVVSVFDCGTFAQTDAWQPVVGTPNRFLTQGSFDCGVFVPAGALVVRFELEACDTSPTGEVAAAFIKTVGAGGGGALVASIGTGTAATPGCARFPFTLPAPEAVDNLTRKYFFEITTGNTAATTVAAVRAFYRLQVSAAPAAATFADVSTSHPYFRFVEALVASGITGGCGSGNYCPDDPITRAQMAVFLATALGLHFSP